MTSYLICRKVCREPTLRQYGAQAYAAVKLSYVQVGESRRYYSGGRYIYDGVFQASIVDARFLLNIWWVQTTHCSEDLQTAALGDYPFDEPLPLDSVKLTLYRYQYDAQSGYYAPSSTSKVGAFSEQGADGDYFWGFGTSNSQQGGYNTSMTWDYDSYIGTSLTLSSATIAQTRLSGPDARFIIRSRNQYEPDYSWGVGTGWIYSAILYMDYDL